MARYKFNQAEYEKWLRDNNLNKATSEAERQAARQRYVEDVLIPEFGDDIDVLNQAISEFSKFRSLNPETLKNIQSSPLLTSARQVVNDPNASANAGAAGGAFTRLNIPSQYLPNPANDVMADLDAIAGKATTDKENAAMEKALADLKKQDILGGITAGTGLLKGATGLGQYLGGRRELKNLVQPKAPIYTPNQNIGSEVARLQVLAQTGDPTIRENAMRDIARFKAQADQQNRIASAGDVSAYGAGASGSNIASMDAARQLAGDEAQRKMAYGQQLMGAIGQQTADAQFKNQADFNNFLANYKEFTRRGDRAAGQMNAGIGNFATGVQDMTAGGANFAGRNAALQKILADFGNMSPEQQSQLMQRFPNIFKNAPMTKPKASTFPSYDIPMNLPTT